MEKVPLYEFENEQAFEIYLTSEGFTGWEYFQENIVSEPHKTFGLYIEDTLVSAIKINSDNSDEYRILAMQTRSDLQHKGYGSKLLKMIIEKYGAGMLVKWTDKTLGFWVKMGFQFTFDFDYMVK